ncbi:MAG: OmpA family protein [Pseudorhodobacter sp.]|nr:OmpA family protein [Frankiaceae bacterium]
MTLTRAAGLLVVLLLAGCSSAAAPARSSAPSRGPSALTAGAPTASPSPAPTEVPDVPGAVTGTGQVGGNDVDYRVRPVVRLGDHAVVTVDLTLVRAAGPALAPGTSAPLGIGFPDPFRQGTSGLPFAAVRLVDLPRRQAYLSARAGGVVTATAVSRSVDVGSSVSGQVAFAAPPAEVTEIGVLIGNLGYVVVPVVDGEVPTVNDTPADRADTNPARRAQLTPADLDASNDAPVVALDSFVEQVGLRARAGTEALRVSLDTEVLFRLDSSALTPAATAALASTAAQLRARAASGRVDVVGYTDDTGSTDHNLELSRARARAVVQALAGSTPGLQLVADGKGEADPAAPNDGDTGRRLNRRGGLTLSAPARPARAPAAGSGPVPALQPGTPTARGLGAATVSASTPKGAPVAVSAPSVLRRDGALVVTLLVANSDPSVAVGIGGLFANGALNARGKFTPGEQYSANAVRLLAGPQVVHPFDYVSTGPLGDRTTLTDQFVDKPVASGRGSQTVTAVFPDVPGTTVTVDVPGVVRLLDVPVTG